MVTLVGLSSQDQHNRVLLPCHGSAPISISVPRVVPVLANVCRYELPEQQVAEAVEAALQLVNMGDFMHRATHTLSGGQRQRVAIAGAGHSDVLCGHCGCDSHCEAETVSAAPSSMCHQLGQQLGTAGAAVIHTVIAGLPLCPVSGCSNRSAADL